MNAGAVPDLDETLAPEPASVSRARRLVRNALIEAGRDDLVEDATLLVSEVVTNAVLHAGTPIALRCRIDSRGARIEVSDGSSVSPSIRHYDANASTGRGLGLVAAMAASWGIDPDVDGKTVWFECRGGTADGGSAEPESSHSVDEVSVRLLNAPTTLVQATIEYGDAVLRELALLSLGGELDDELPDGWHLPPFDVTPILAAAAAATAEGRTRSDLELRVPASAGPAALERMRLIDHADGLARQGRLLTQPAIPEIGVCRHWIYSSISEQLLGAAPEEWELPEPLEPAQVAASMPESEIAEILASPVAVLAADDANRILVVNAAAAALLRWSPDELCGQRLVTIIPHELREAHLAGFAHFQRTGEGPILGRSVEVPALRRDGTRVEISLVIEPLQHEGRTSFRASLFAL